jgi:predicted nucleic acid-binding Zn ribbon protein
VEYKYRCPDCRYNFSICIPMTNKLPDWAIGCPKCKKSGQVKRVWDKFSFILRGSGFYRTDYGESNE